MIRHEWRLAAGYFAYFGCVGVLQPFFPVYLASLGVAAAGIGTLQAVWSGMRLIAPVGAAWFADSQPDRRPLLRAMAVASVAASAVLASLTSFGGLCLAIALFSLVFNGLLPVYDAHALERLGAAAARYGWLRLWGSIGFIVLAVATGFVAARTGPAIVPLAASALVAALALLFLRLPAAPIAPRARVDLAAFATAIARPRVAAFLAVCFLHLAGFGGFYTFYSLYLARAGYGSGAVGVLWAVGVGAEVALFAIVPRLIARYPLARLLEAALALSVLRWVVVAAFPTVPALMAAAQLLHGAGFGLFHAVTVLLGPTLMPPGTGARAQALVSSLGWGGGGIAGSLVAGYLWDRGGPRSVFVASAALALLAWLLGSMLLSRPGPRGSRSAAPGR